MRNLTYYVATSIDGFIAGPLGETDFLPLDDDVLAHIVEAYPDTVPTHQRAAVGLAATNDRFDTVVMGRHTYLPALEAGITSPYAHLRQFVVSSRLERSPDPAVCLVREDPLDAVRALKRTPGRGIWLAGGAQLAGALLPEIDELVVKTYPVVAGAGNPMFRTGFDATSFRLTSARTFGSGASVAVYTRSTAEDDSGAGPSRKEPNVTDRPPSANAVSASPAPTSAATDGWEITSASDADWVPWGARGDARAKVLGRADGYVVACVEAPAGYTGTAHDHGHAEFLYVVGGRLRNEGRVLCAGDGCAAAAGSRHTEFVAETDATYVSVFKL